MRLQHTEWLLCEVCAACQPPLGSTTSWLPWFSSEMRWCWERSTGEQRYAKLSLAAHGCPQLLLVAPSCFSLPLVVLHHCGSGSAPGNHALHLAEYDPPLAGAVQRRCLCLRALPRLRLSARPEHCAVQDCAVPGIKWRPHWCPGPGGCCSEPPCVCWTGRRPFNTAPLAPPSWHPRPTLTPLLAMLPRWRPCPLTNEPLKCTCWLGVSVMSWTFKSERRAATAVVSRAVLCARSSAMRFMI